MKMLDSSGALTQPQTKGRQRRAKSPHYQTIFDWATTHTIKAVDGEEDGLLRLQEIKNRGASLKGNPWNMNLQPGEANAKVRQWCYTLVSKPTRATTPSGKVESQHLDALEFGDAVVFINFQAAHHHISQLPKSKQASAQKRLDVFKQLPQRASYYK